MGGFGCEAQVGGGRRESKGNSKKDSSVCGVSAGAVGGGNEVAQNITGESRERGTCYDVLQRNITMGWRGVENVDIIAFETGTNIQSLSRSWNKRTQSWLEQYVYQRTNRSLIVTYAVSALWHGLYPGFFMFFFAAALMSAIERLVRTKINPLILTDPESPLSNSPSAVAVKTVYSFVGWILTSATLTYHAQTFYMKSFERSIGAFRSFHFIPNIAFVMFYVLLELAPTPAKSGLPGNKKKSD